jgi:S1-C subfamily serine protease
MLSIVDDEIVNELPGPVKGYKTRLTWGLDWYDVIVRVVPVRGKTIQGKSIQGHFVELGGKGTYPTQRPQEIIDEITKKLNGTNTMVVVESIERGSYSTQRNLPIVTSGTGWFSESGYFITNHHVVEGAKVIKVQYRGKEYPAELVLKDEQNDIALLSITDACSMPPAFKFSQGKPQLGQVVFTVGFPQTGILGKSAKYASGEISSLRGIQDDPRFIQTSLPVHGGNSGGPLVNDKGEVVGMVTAKIDTMAFLEKTGDVAQNISYAIKRQYIEMLTSSVEKKTICGKIFEGKAAAQEQGLDLADIVVRVVAE